MRIFNIWKIKQEIRYYFSLIHDCLIECLDTPDISNCDNIPVIYEADINSSKNFIVSSVVLENGNIIAARSGGKVVCIKNGIETELLNVEGATDWRGLWKDSKGNVFISPHSTPSLGSININARGIYKLSPYDTRFRKTMSLYDPVSNIAVEREKNDDTIWTFCEDNDNNIYAGVYAHTMRKNPSIYKSNDMGETWELIYNFNEAGLTKNAKHIHGIVYSPVQNALYALVGEINELFESKDGGKTWNALGVQTELAKGCTLYAVEDGIIIGSDSAYDCIMSKYYFASKKILSTSRIFGGTIFAIRKSDNSNRIYAFSKVDSSVNVLDYYPPIEALEDDKILSEWIKSKAMYKYQWKLYNHRMKKKYPDDAVRPQHVCILMSENNGDSWSIIYKIKTTSAGPNGFWTTGFFYKGECLTGFVGKTLKYEKPVVISETGNHYFI